MFKSLDSWNCCFRFLIVYFSLETVHLQLIVLHETTLDLNGRDEGFLFFVRGERVSVFFIMIHESESNEESSHQHLTDFLPLVSLKLNNLNLS